MRRGWEVTPLARAGLRARLAPSRWGLALKRNARVGEVLKF